MWFYPFGALFNLVTSLLIGSFVLSKNWRAKANIGFFLFGFSVAFWSLGYFFWQVSTNARDAVFWCRVLSLGSIWITIWYYYFVIQLLDLKPRKYRVIFVVGVTLASIFSLSDFTTGLMIESVKPFMFFKFWPVPGFFYHIYLAMFLFYAYYAAFLLYIEFKTGGEFRKRQIKYVFLGTFIGYLGGCTNYPAWYGIQLPPIGNILVGVYPILVGYSIVKYRLFEIDTVIHRTILWLLTSSSVLLPIGVMLFFTRDWFTTLSWVQLTFVMTGLFYLYLFYYRKMQPRIDHLFRRRKYDYYAVLAELGQHIGSELDIERVINRLFKELKEILYIRNGLLLVQQPGEIDYTDAGSTGYDTNITSLSKKELKRTLIHDSRLSIWLSEHQRALEREQMLFDPQYASIKEEAIGFFNKYSTELIIPVIMEDKINALLGIGKKDNLQAYTVKDIELLEHMGRQIGITIDNALHHEDIVEKERLAEELKLGREIQMALLPGDAPFVPGLTVLGLMQPAKEIGGDYYDFITLPREDELSIAIGDVAGKGVAAGLLMAMAKTAIHTLSQEVASPKQILVRTNQILSLHIGGQKFMTLLYLNWQSKTKTITYSSAGHEHILIYRANQGAAAADGTPVGVVETIMSGGFMLGMLPDIGQFLEEKQIKLGSKDKILLYTDGVTEAQNQHVERLGLARLQGIFLKHGKLPAAEFIRAVKDEVYSFIGNHPQYDDITLVVLEAK